MKDSSLLAMITGKNTTDVWSSINAYLMEYDDPNTRNYKLNKLMAAIVFTSLNQHAFSQKLNANITINAHRQSSEDVNIRGYIRKCISQLNEVHPFDVVEVQEQVLSALQAQRQMSEMLSNGSIDSSLKYMQLLSELHDTGEPSSRSIENRLGYEAIEQLMDTGRVSSMDDTSQARVI